MNWSLLESRHYASWLLLSLCMLGIAPCHANDDAVSEKDYLQDLPVVLSASRLNQPLSEAPNAVTVIDRDMIKASGFRTIADVFRLVPGMYVGYLEGHAPIVAYHGSTDEYSRRMQVLVDGRSVYLPPFSTVDWEDIPLHINDIERIEVIRGPAAASHGANSFQGVINIITRDAGSVDGATVSVTKGEGGVSDASAHLGNSGANLDYRVTLGYRSDNGFDINAMNDSATTRLANLRANYHPAGPDSFDFQLGYSEGNRGQGIADREYFRDASVYSHFQQVAWLRVLPQGDELKLQYFHISSHAKDPGGTILRSDNILSTVPAGHTVVHRHDVELQHTTQLSANNRLVWGGGVRKDSAESPLNMNAPLEIEQSRLFAHDEWRMSPAALLNVGAMFEKDGMGHANTSPRASFNYHLAPQQTLRVGTSVAYRSPAFVEEKGYIPGYFLAAGGLLPEKIHSKEIGYLGEFSTLGLSVDARFFYDRLSDVIYLDPLALNPPVWGFRPYNFRNLAGATHRGFESTLKYRWQEKNSLIFNYARQAIGCYITGSLSNPHPLIQNALQNMINTCADIGTWNGGSVLLTQQLRHDIQLSAGYYHQGPLPILQTSEQTAMRRVDLRIAKSLAKSAFYTGGELALVVQNAFQDDYSEYSTTPQTDNKKFFNKRAYLTATLNF